MKNDIKLNLNLSKDGLNLLVIAIVGVALFGSLYMGWLALQNPDQSLVQQPVKKNVVAVPELQLNHTYQRQGAEIKVESGGSERANPFQ